MNNRKNTQTSTPFKPPIRMTDDGRDINFRIDLPGVAEEEIRIDLERTTVTLSVLKDNETLRTEFDVPKGARFYRKKFSGGVLEIIFEKPGS